MAFLLLGATLGIGQAKKSPVPDVQEITFPELQVMMHNDSGKVILVNFWASWCKPCKEEMPALVKLRKSMKKEVSVFIVSADDADDLDKDVRSVLNKSGVNFRSFIVKGTVQPFIMAMNPEWNGALALPMTYVYRKSGGLSDWIVGSRDYEGFKDLVTKAMTD
ncbi:MAG TPA: TlpA disulfide reductase family protein [Bacteroidota bacterium]|nr:TlpA disulfide reductase family protein [Bacteroidota bacterium]